VEYAFWNNWSVKAEYLCYNFGATRRSSVDRPVRAGDRRFLDRFGAG
jgi:hypothetical protein